MADSIRKEILLNRLYYSMKQSSTNLYYSAMLLDKHSRCERICNGFVTVLSIGGAALALINEYIPMATGIVVGLVSITKSFFPVFFMEPQDIKKLSELTSSYRTFLQKLQNVFDELYSNEISEQTASEKYDSIINEYSNSDVTMSLLFGKIDKKIEKIAAQRSDNYLNEIYKEIEV